MIGNDVVDLALARTESNWRRPGFISKIFTEKEQKLIEAHDNPELLIWNLWSRKEAVYKIYNRETGIRAYIPQQIECVYSNEYEGKVLCKNKYYYTKTSIENDFLHSIAVTDETHFDLIISVDLQQKIVKKEGIPFIQCNYSHELIPVSISHHGRYHSGIMLK
jgi:phosphopantetheinyl transferase (holo-ACP synthase)